MKKRLQRTGTTIAWSVTILGKLCSFGCASLAAILISSSAANAQPLQLVSVPDSARLPAETGDGDSVAPIISADGRYVLFASTANNLVVMGTNRPIPAILPPPLNVFLRDRTSHTTTLVSVNVSGTGGGNGSSWPVAVSTNGQFVLFESSASNLVTGDTNNFIDVFVRDLVAGHTTLVSVRTNGVPANGASYGSAMTPDGRYVAFVSGATNLVAGPFPFPWDTNGIPDTFVRDLQAGVTRLASVGARRTSFSSTIPSFFTASSPDISADGRYVVFSSLGTNIVPGVTTSNQIYVRDMVASNSVWASIGATQAVVPGGGQVLSYNYTISADGRFVAYEASPELKNFGRILRYGVQTGLTDTAYTNAAAIPLGDNRSLAMTPDGRFIAFVANANGPVPTNTCILVWDAQSGTTNLASVDLLGQLPARTQCLSPAIDPTGRFVAFLSNGTNFVTNSLVGEYHLYVRDMQSNSTILVDAGTNGVGSPVNWAAAPSISEDGQVVAFEAADGSLAPGDSNRGSDVFVYDLTQGSTEAISVRAAALPNLVPDGGSMLWPSALSADARFVTFTSDADDLVPNDTNGCRDVFMRDLLFGTNVLVSVSTNGVSPGDNVSSEPVITPDGRYVAFSSSADSLVPGDNNKAVDVFVRDLQAGTTTLVSINSSGTGPGTNNSWSPMISSDGRFVLFRSGSKDLAPGISYLGAQNLLLRDMQAGSNVALTLSGAAFPATMTPNGRYVGFVGSLSPGAVSNLFVWDTQLSARVYTNTNNAVLALALSPDGQTVFFGTANGLYAIDRIANTSTLLATNRLASRFGMRLSADGRFMTYSAASGTNNQIYVYDFQIGTNLLISKNFGSGSNAFGTSDSPDISADGRYIAYRSFAEDIVTGDTNRLADVFLYDQQSGVSGVLTVPADIQSRSPIFSSDGQILIFESAASDLIDTTFGFTPKLFVFSPYPPAPFAASITVDVQGAHLKWPVEVGKTYQVEFKDALSDPWQGLSGSVTLVGRKAVFDDLSLGISQRFYRIVAF